jgi:hypothetical protein
MYFFTHIFRSYNTNMMLLYCKNNKIALCVGIENNIQIVNVHRTQV